MSSIIDSREPAGSFPTTTPTTGECESETTACPSAASSPPAAMTTCPMASGNETGTGVSGSISIGAT